MEAASIAQQRAPFRQRFAKAASDNLLWIVLGGALLALFVGSPQRTANNVVDGLSIGLVWALIALGYTLVYGIIELINFAHGEVFMIGAFVSVSLYGTLGLTTTTGTLALIGGLVVVLAISM